MADDTKAQSWWSTLPGILTAVAGVLTAATGLVAAIKQLGLFDHAPSPAPVVQPGGTTANSTPAIVPATDKTTPAPATNDTATLVGSWHDNADAPRGPFRMTLRAEGDKLYVHIWARCRPKPCDWGEAAASPLGEAQAGFSAHFTDSERDTSVKFHALAADTLELDYVSKFPDGKPDFSASRVFKRGG